MNDEHFPGDRTEKIPDNSRDASVEYNGDESVEQQENKIIDLVDVVEEEDIGVPEGCRVEEIERIVAETAERIAREMFPSIAERVIREEIAKLKNED